MQRSQESGGKSSQSNAKRICTTPLKSSTICKGKRKKVSSTSAESSERMYTSSDSSEVSSSSTVIEGGSPTSSLRYQLPIPCFHKSIGCSRFFYSYVDRNRHGKHCIFSFFKTCQEPKCEDQFFVGTFSDYLEHAHSDHSVPLIAVGNNQPVTVALNNSDDFYNSSERAYASKVLAGFEQKSEGVHFNLAMYALVKAFSYGTPVMSVIPVIYARNSQVYHFVRLTLALRTYENNEAKQLPLFGSMRHPSHLRDGGYKVITTAFNCPEDIIRFMQSYRLMSYGIEDAKKAKEMTVSIEFCRVEMKHEKNVKLKPYFLTWEETNLQKQSQELLSDCEKENPDPISAVLLPQLIEKQNILLEFIDVMQVLYLMIAQVRDQIKKDGVKKGTRKPKLMLLYPDDLTLAYEGRNLKKFILRAGISAFLIPLVNAEFVAKFEKCGTDIILSTPDALKEFLGKKPGELEDLIFSSLQYIVLPQADLARRHNNANVIGEILATVSETKRKSIGRLAITPFLNRRLVHLLRQSFFEKEYKLLSIGESPAVQIRNMKAIDIPAVTEDIKISKVIRLVVSGIGGRCLILANEFLNGYSTAYDNLIAKLEEAVDAKKLSMVRTINDAHSNPNAFDEFRLEPDGILLTSYFSLMFLDVIKLCDVIVLFTLPTSNAELARLITFARKEDGSLKRIYNLLDYGSPNKITTDYFVD